MKYKLIKEYPGSPKLETVVEVKSDGYIHWNVNSNENNPTNYIHNSAMKQYKEFWEEVVEKDYEILSFIVISNNYIMKLCAGTFSNDGLTEKDLLKDKDCKIHSVKRLSDGEIFTIGDDILSKTCGVPNKILSIEIINNKIRLYPRNSFYNLGDVRKAEQKLFTTEDGVDIFNLNRVFYINGWSDYVLDVLATTNSKHTQNKYFSTKEKAEEYILLNKPVLSVNDVINFFDYSPLITKDRLKNIVKSKI